LEYRIISGGARFEAQAFNPVVDCASQIPSPNMNEFLGHRLNICAALVENIKRNLMKAS
jgi:hypothetical protein